MPGDRELLGSEAEAADELLTLLPPRSRMDPVRPRPRCMLVVPFRADYCMGNYGSAAQRHSGLVSRFSHGRAAFSHFSRTMGAPRR